jgi:LPXTG-motif cell wall-anchored protein
MLRYRCGGRRVAGFASLLLAGLTGIAVAPPAHADYATGGTGRYVDSIQWFKWGNDNTPIPNGGITQTNTVVFGSSTLSITCNLANITDVRGGTIPAGAILSAYRPGNYSGDYLDDLYNIGGLGGANTLQVGLKNTVGGRWPQFDFSCSALLDGSPFPLAGLVMADAESTGIPESLAATIPTSATWRVIDRGVSAPCASNSTIATRSGNTLSTSSTGECTSGTPIAVTYMQGTASATNVTVRGGGTQAIALGVVVSLDYGDAPASYGTAVHAVQYGFTGGTIADGAVNVRLHDPAFALATPVMPPTRLGAIVDPEDPGFAGAGATGDDASTNPAFSTTTDEDSITPPAPVVLQAGTPYTIPSVACTGPGFVAGWIDWNVNGIFDTNERSTPVECTGSSVSMTWAVPGGGVIPTAPTPSYLRLRIGPTLASMTLPTGLLPSGEAEDYAMTISVPKPVAVNDTATTPKGTAVTLPIVTNDTPGAASAPLNPATVQLKDPVDGLLKSTVTIPGEGTYTVNAVTGAVTFTPVGSFTGAATPVTYQVADTNGSVTTATITVTVKPGPIAVPDVASTPQNVNITVDPASNDAPSPGGSPLVPSTVQLKDPATGVYGSTVTIPGEGTYTVDAAGKVTFDPLPGFVGAATPVPYQVKDTDGVTATSTIAITVTPVTPIAVDDTASTPFDTNVTIPLLTNDTPGAASAPLVPSSVKLKDPTTGAYVTTVTIPGEGTYTVNPATGAVMFDPLPTFFGVATPITYQVADANGTIAAAKVTVTVAGPPKPAPDTGITAQNVNVTVDPLANDLPGFGGSPLVPSSVKLLDPATGTYGTSVTIPGEGTYTVDPVTGKVTFDPLPTFTGAATPIIYQVKDAAGASATSTIAITVMPITPVATDNTAATTSDTNVTLDVLANDAAGAPSAPLDPTSVRLKDPATGLFATTVTVPGEGTYTVDPATGKVTFDPLPTFFGTATPVTYQVKDANGTAVTAMITVTVAPKSPTASPDTNVTPQGTPVTTPVLGNDATGSTPLDPASVKLKDPVTGVYGTTVTVPGEGTYTVNPATGAVVFTPLPTFIGVATPITYQAKDTSGGTASSTVTITVTPVIPVLVNDTAATPPDTNVTVPLLTNDTPGVVSVPLNPTSVQLKDPVTGTYGTSVTVPGQGTWTVNPTTGAVTFDPLPTFSGIATPLTYRAKDANGTAATATVTVTVAAPPTPAPDTGVTAQNVNVTVDPLANDLPGGSGGAPLDPTSVKLKDPTTGLFGTSVTIPGEGTYTVDPVTGKVTFDPLPTFTGSATPITYQVKDTAGGMATSTIAIAVTPITPVAVDNDASTVAGSPVTVPVLGNDLPGAASAPLDPTSVLMRDPADGVFKASVTIPGEGTYTVDPTTGKLTFTPVAGFTGVTTPVTYQVQDTNDTTVTAKVTVTVTVAPKPKPVGKPDVVTGAPNTPVTLDPLTNDKPSNGGTYIPSTLHLVDPKTGKPVDSINVPGKGTWSVKNGKVTFTPVLGFTGKITNTYTVQDTKGGVTTSTISVTIPTGTGSPTQPGTDNPIPVLPHTGAGMANLALSGTLLIALGAVLARRRRVVA